jgi:hypothetical protein
MGRASPGNSLLKITDKSEICAKGVTFLQRKKFHPREVARDRTPVM